MSDKKKEEWEKWRKKEMLFEDAWTRLSNYTTERLQASSQPAEKSLKPFHLNFKCIAPLQ